VSGEAGSHQSYDWPWPSIFDDPDRGCSGAPESTFFPGRGASTNPAKRICKTCPGLDECLEWALQTNQDIGVYGATSARQRRRIRKQREMTNLNMSRTDRIKEDAA
jgi:hypothetical protein